MAPPLRAVLTDAEKVSVRHHMGYLNVDEVQTFAIGVPAGVETQFIIEGAMNRVNLAALPLLRRIVGILDTIEGQMIDDLELLAVTRLDTIEIDPKEQEKLTKQYNRWVNSLGNVLGVARNPFDARTYNQQGGGINAGVQG